MNYAKFDFNMKKGVRVNPIIIGGGQERGFRSGSENIPGIVGFAKAAEITKEEMPLESERLKKLRDNLIKRVLDFLITHISDSIISRENP